MRHQSPASPTSAGRHLLLATVEDPNDPRSWSGIPIALRKALEQELETLTVLRPSRPARNPIDVLRRVVLRQPLWMTEATLRSNAREVGQAIKRSRPQALLSISSQCIAKLSPFPIPTYLFSDAPWLSWKQTYAEYEPMPARGPEFARLEAAAARRCTGLFFGSGWACREADRLYFGERATAEQRAGVHEVHLGANWKPEITPEELRAVIHARRRDRLDLLFVGKDWERKGGPLAVEVVRHLQQSGVKATLHIVGCRPKLAAALLDGDHPLARVHGPLYQNEPTQRRELQKLFLHSHLLLVPTRAECFGIVFAEAQAFGLPPVSRNVQALPSVVLDGETGLLLPPDATPQSYADRILALTSDWDIYLAMADRGVERASTVTNWRRTAEVIVSTIFGPH